MEICKPVRFQLFGGLAPCGFSLSSVAHAHNIVFALCRHTGVRQHFITGQQQLSGDTFAIGILLKFIITNPNG